MYQVIGNPGSRTLRVYWALEEMGLDYEMILAMPRSEQVRRLNPSGKIPCLLVEGHPVLDSVAIIQFLADRHGQLTYPAGTLERAEQDSWTQFACDEVDGPVWHATKQKFVVPEEYRIEGMRRLLDYEFGRAMKTLSARLGDRPFVTGDRFTVPDIILGHLGRWARKYDFEIPQGPVADYFDRMAARPALARALEKAEAARAALG